MTRCAAIVRSTVDGSNFGRITTPAASSAAIMPFRAATMWYIGATSSSRSDDVTPVPSSHCIMFTSSRWCVSITPFERPVVPPV